MSRVKKGVSALKRRRSVLSKTKGYRFGRKSKEREAKVAIRHAGVHAFRDRRNKKRNYRGLWQIKINALVRDFDMSYSKFISLLKKNNVEIDRKILAELAEKHSEIIEKIIKTLK